MLWLGRIFSGLVAALLTLSAVQKLNPSPEALQGFQTFGYSAEVLLPIGVVELLCVLVYLVPRTSVLGAILITGYLGGATATHVRVSDAFIVPILLGVVAWAGLFLRDARIRDLLPLRR
ncbi:Arginine/ornithine antiporter ArcD [Myxococcus hansupus]|uniref:Arginine/ornithine antiporter ArcD n=2 Tax=Pseudomyxococcus hansupus TaxID=1297742 RepID=A0A0H4WT69_9BACT|nr:Arginine/ornithine antiporter ArcD [Myxococcus hansupus]